MTTTTVWGKFEDLLAAGKVTFDFNGHFRNRKTQPKVPSVYIWEFRRDFGLEETFRDHMMHVVLISSSLLSESHLSESSLRNCIDLDVFRKRLSRRGKTMSLPTPYDMRHCGDCGAKLEFTFDGRTIGVQDPCKYPKGHPPFQATISCPSGVLVFANYFDFADPPRSTECMPRMAGLKFETRHYAKQNIAYAFCGNTCPTVFINEDRDSLIVGLYSGDEHGEKGFDGYQKTTQVVTDLWAWSAMDIDCLRQQVKKNKDSSMKHYRERVKVKPGKYRVTQRIHVVNRDDSSKPHKLATLKLV